MNDEIKDVFSDINNIFISKLQEVKKKINDSIEIKLFNDCIDKKAMNRLAKYLSEKLLYRKILGKIKLVDCIKMSSKFKGLLLKENSDMYTKSSF